MQVTVKVNREEVAASASKVSIKPNTSCFIKLEFGWGIQERATVSQQIKSIGVDRYGGRISIEVRSQLNGTSNESRVDEKVLSPTDE